MIEAWKHSNHWDDEKFMAYRNYVARMAPQLRGRTEDCADLSMLLFIDFAADNGLPVTFWDNDRILIALNEAT